MRNMSTNVYLFGIFADGIGRFQFALIPCHLS